MKVMIRKPTQVQVFYNDGTRESVEKIAQHLKKNGSLVVCNGQLISIHLIDTVLYLTPGKYLVIDEGNDYHVYDQEGLSRNFDELPNRVVKA